MKRNASSVSVHSCSPPAQFVHQTAGAASAVGRGPHTGTPRYDAPSSCAPSPVQPAFAAAASQWAESQSLPPHQLGQPYPSLGVDVARADPAAALETESPRIAKATSTAAAADGTRLTGLCTLMFYRTPRRKERRAVPSAAVAEQVDTNSFKNGMHIELDGKVWRIVEFQHVKPGKGGAFVRTKLKALDAGNVVDRTFRAGEKFPRIRTETKSVQFLYDDGSEVHFMDDETYDQFALPHAEVADELPYMQPNAPIQILSVNGKPSSVQLPSSVELKVVETEPGVKGDTVSNVTKPARLETGAVVQVPLFVNVGDRLKVDPREGRYISRA